MLKVLALEDGTEDSVTSWIASFKELTQSREELSDSSIDDTLSGIEDVLQAVGNLELPFSTSVSLLDALDSTISAYVLYNQISKDNNNTAIDVKVRTILQKFGNITKRSMLPSQEAYYVVNDAIRLSLHAYSSNSTIAQPLTALETLNGYSAPSLRLRTQNASLDRTKVSLISLSAMSLNRTVAKSIYSNPLTIEMIELDGCDDSKCAVEVTLQNIEPINFKNSRESEGVEWVNHTCLANIDSTVNYTCRDGYFLNTACDNYTVDTIVSLRCPTAYEVAACNRLLDDGSTSSTGCEVLSFTNTHVVCSCSLFDNGGRRLFNGTSELQNGYSVTYVSMAKSVRDTFVETVISAGNLNANTAEQGIPAIVTLGLFASCLTIALLWSHYADRKMKQIVSPLSKKKDSSSLATMGSLDSKKAMQTRPVSKTKRISTKSPQFFDKLVAIGSGMSNRRNSSLRTIKKAINADLQTIEESLPMVLTEQPLYEKFLAEIKRHHRWFAIIFFYSELFPRSLRIISLATNVVVMLFIQSLTYNLTNPNDGICETLSTEETCLEPRSPYDSSKSKCSWYSSTAGGSCLFIEPDQDFRIILFIAVFSAVVATPIALAADWLIRTVLAAPTKTIDSQSPRGDSLARNYQAQESLKCESNQTSFKRQDVFTSFRKSSIQAITSLFNFDEVTNTRAEAMKDYEELQSKLQQYRDSLTTLQKVEFDGKKF